MNQKLIFLLVFGIHVAAAFLSVGFYQYDEHYQIFEFLSYLQGKTPGENLTWEFTSQMRGWLQPFLYYLLLKPFQLIGLDSSFSHAFIIRLFSSLLGATSQYFLAKQFLNFSNITGKKRDWSFIALNLAWFLPFIHTRPSSENFAGIFIAFAIAVFLSPKKNHFLMGLFCGLSYLFRYQMGVVVAVFWFWQLFIGKEKLKNLFLQALAIIFCFILGVGVDYIGYGELTFSPWHYFNENILLGKQAGYGGAPWWKMIEYIFFKSIPPISVLILFACSYFWFRKPKHFLSSLTLSLFLVHIAASGKHIRFLFPLAPFVPIMILIMIDELKIFKEKWAKHFLKWSMGINLILILPSLLKLPGVDIGMLNYINHKKIDEVFYVGENPFIKTPGPLMFYLDQPTVFEKWSPSELSTVKKSFYLSTDRLNLFREYSKRDSCIAVYRQRFSHLMVRYGKDKNRHWALFQCNLD